MAENGAVIPQLTDYLFTKSSRLKVPLSGTFELTPICNFSCKMCYVRKTAEEVAAHSRPILKPVDWLNIAREAADNGMLYLLLTGGEPFIYPEFDKLYRELSKMGLLISVNSNGSLISGENIALLKEAPPRRVNITLYGASDETYKSLCGVSGVFGKVCRNIEALRNAGIQVKLNCSLTPYNIGDIEKITDFAESHSLNLDIASYMFPPVRRDAGSIGKNERFTPKQAAYYRLYCYKLQFGEEKYLNYLKSILKGSIPPPGLEEGCVDPADGSIRCRAGKASFWITWDGRLTPCGMMPDPKIELSGKSFEAAWNELVRAADSLVLSGVCVKCPNRQLCHSCAAMAATETGSASGIPSYLCRVVEEMRRLAENELKNL